MTKPNAFISHTSKDDPFVKELRQTLERSGVNAWADSREMAGGDLLSPEVDRAIEGATAFLLVISQNSLANPHWVRKETRKALSVQALRGPKNYRIIPLLLDGLGDGVLEHFFDEIPVGVKISIQTGGLQDAFPAILTSLELRLPDDPTPAIEPSEPPVNELCLVLEVPELYTEGGVRRGKARAHFQMLPADNGEIIETDAFDFICPIGPIEADRMRWYIEDYPQAPFLEKILERGAAIEKEIAVWGKLIFDALTQPTDARELFWEWKGDQVHERRFSVKFNFLNDKNPGTEKQEAANILMATPWEILHDGQGFLFQGKKPVRVRRRVPNRGKKENLPLRDKLRVLLLSPRPVDEQASYIDHRVSPKALLEAIEPLGERAELVFLREPSFAAMCAAIREAEKQEQPFSVVHFDGHGVFDRHRGLGALCFESSESGEQQKLEGRKTHLVYADEILSELRGYRIPFFFLDACQSAVAEKDPAASVAATLLETGAASVAAMSYSVLVSTAEAFARAFYAELAKGSRIGSAMLAGQRALHEDPVRAELPQGEKLRMQDWFVPVLFQEQKDPRLVKAIPGAQTQKVVAEQREIRAGWTPDRPHGGHHFVGRKLELLTLERLLLLEPWALLLGQGGAGKTTLAAELARWMLRTGHFERLAFVSFEGLSDVRTAIDALGKQLLGEDFSVATYENEDKAMLHIERQLENASTLIILDNLESIQPLPGGEPLLGVAPFEEFLAFFSRLQKSSKSTRLLLTSREPLPAPFHTGRNVRRIGQLAPGDALRLIAEVMKTEGIPVPSMNVEDLEEQFGALARTANYHARALTLLTKTLAQRGEELPELNADLSHLMVELEKKHPGERENSLFASLELSLRRLPEELRVVVDALGVYHGGADLVGWAKVAGQEPDFVAQAGIALIEVGLAELALNEFPYFFKTDPTLPAWLAAHTLPEVVEARRERWVECMRELSSFLYEQQFKNTQLAHDLARLCEANLLALLAEMEKQAGPEELVETARDVESLFSPLGRRQALQFAQNVRERAVVRIGEWSHAQFLSKGAAIERFLEQGNLPAAFQLAKEVWERCELAGVNAYPEAEYDGAMAHFRFARILQTAGQTEQALPFLQEARKRFLSLAGTTNANAEHMASACLTELGDCFTDLGHYDAAAAQYQKAIELDEKRNSLRDVAVGKNQLATARMFQKDYTEALRLYAEAKAFFERNHEPTMVATAWHQIGMTHQEAQNYLAAEKAYQESLSIKIREKNKAGEASSLCQLGNLYSQTERFEDAVRMYERAVTIYVELRDARYEGVTRNNLADTLLKLFRPDEARKQLLRAIECKAEFGHAATPWTTWSILSDLETHEGNTTAATEARQKAIAAYEAYRRDGGESQNNRFNYIAATAKAIQSGETQELIAYLESTLEPGDPVEYVACIRALLALLRGQQDPALAEDPELHYMDAVDLRLVFFEGA